MKVLWFSLSPCNSIKRNNSIHVIQGWMVSLENEIKKCADIQLNVAFFTNVDENSFYFEGVRYYPMKKNVLNQNIALNRVLERRISEKRKDARIIKMLLDVVKQSSPDIIHIHGTEESFGLVAEHIKNIPIVFSIQGLIAPYKEKYFSGISKNQAYNLDSFIDRLKGVGIKKQYQSFCYRAEREKSFLNRAKYIFGRTFWDRDCTLTLNPKRKYYVVNEILRPEFYTKHWKGFISDNKIKIVSTISGGVYKGFETILKTAVILKKYSHLDFEWHIAGYTSKTKWVHICEKITNIKSENANIIFHGQIDADELSDLLCSSDIYVQVSHIENSPNSVCEAMMLGMPIIASYAGGTASLLENGKEGILYQDGDPYVLAGAVMHLYKNPEMAIAFGTASYKRAHYRHNKERIVGELLSGYESIIKDFNISNS